MIPAVLAIYIEGLKTHDVGKIGSALVDEVVFVTPATTLRKAEILAFLTALYRGFPDWTYEHDEPVKCEDGSYDVNWRQCGTHTGTLAYPGFDAVAATGRKVVIPEHFFHYRWGEDGLTEIRPDPVPGGAPRGIFEQIGVELPPF